MLYYVRKHKCAKHKEREGGVYDFSESACIETLYTELPFLERFCAAKADGFDFVEFWS